MAESKPTSPTPEDMHWGISYLREDLQDVKPNLRDFRKEFADYRKEVAAEFANARQDFGEQLADLRRELRLDLRHNLMVTVGVSGLFAAIVIAFIEYRLPGG